MWVWHCNMSLQLAIYLQFYAKRRTLFNEKTDSGTAGLWLLRATDPVMATVMMHGSDMLCCLIAIVNGASVNLYGAHNNIAVPVAGTRRRQSAD